LYPAAKTSKESAFVLATHSDCQRQLPFDPPFSPNHLSPLTTLLPKPPTTLTPTTSADPSYAALGLLPSIPLPSGPSSSRSHRAKLPFLPGQPAEQTEEEMLKSAVVGYGRIVRDEEGNVIDIILPEDDEVVAGESAEQVPEEDEAEEVKHVEAKTDVVRCEWFFSFFHENPRQVASDMLRGASCARFP